jgi:hypothetical protein
MARVLRPEGRLAIMVPTAAGGALNRLGDLLPGSLGLHLFDLDEIADTLLEHGLSKVRVNQRGLVGWVRGSKPAS